MIRLPIINILVAYEPKAAGRKDKGCVRVRIRRKRRREGGGITGIRM